MPVYNTAEYLEECIESILNQSFIDFEFIISDDGSTDGSKEIIQKYELKDKRIIFINNQTNRWICANLNDCIKKASGEYIAIMESDDVSFPKRFEIQISEFEKNKTLDLIGTQWELINSYGKKITDFNKITDYKKIVKDIWYYYPFINPSIMMKRDILKKVWPFNADFDFIQDYELMIRIIISNYKVKNISSRLIKYRVHNKNISLKKRIFLINTAKKMQIKYLKLQESNFCRRKFLYMYGKIYCNYFKNLSLWYTSIWIQKLQLYNFIAPVYRKFFI